MFESINGGDPTMYDIYDINVKKKKSFCIGMVNAQTDDKLYCNIVKKKTTHRKAQDVMKRQQHDNSVKQRRYGC